VPAREEGLSRDLWPAHPKPKPDEILSSWLVRLTMAHGLKLHTFCSLIWPHKQIWNRDIDKSADERMLSLLAQKTGTPPERVFGTTLAAYQGKVFEKHNPFGNTLWIMPVGVYHRTRRRFGLQFCPLCLAEDSLPYFRRRWRLAFITCCERHGITLLDRCPRCGDSVNFHRNEMGDRNKQTPDSMVHCHACRFDLREADGLSSPHDSEAIIFQKKLLQAVKDGWIEIKGYGFIHSRLYFLVLHQLLRLFGLGRRAAAFQRAANESFGCETFAITSRRAERDVEHFQVVERQKLLLMVRRLLEDWPNRFIGFCEGNQIWSATLLRDMDYVPFWYWNVIHDYLYRAPYQPSDREICSVVKYIIRTGGVPYKKAISKYLGASNVFQKRRAGTSFIIRSFRCPKNMLRHREVKVVSIL
jgi:hypothetical protein